MNKRHIVNEKWKLILITENQKQEAHLGISPAILEHLKKSKRDIVKKMFKEQLYLMIDNLKI